MMKLISAAVLAVSLVGGAAVAQPAGTASAEPRFLDSYAQGTMRDLADRRSARQESMKRGGGMHRGPRGGMMKRGMHRGQRHHVN